MSAEQNKATYQRFVDEVINRGNFAVGEQLLSPDFVDHTPQPGQSPDRAGYLEVFRQFRSAFPDLTVTVDALVCDGDLVA
jgi:predicted ester cyclase